MNYNEKNLESLNGIISRLEMILNGVDIGTKEPLTKLDKDTLLVATFYQLQYLVLYSGEQKC